METGFLLERFIDIIALIIGFLFFWYLGNKVFRKIYIKKLPAYLHRLVPIIFPFLTGMYVHFLFPLYPSFLFTFSTFIFSAFLGTWYGLVDLTMTPFFSENPLENALHYVTYEVARPIERGNSKCEICGEENQSTFEVEGSLICGKCSGERDKTITQLSKSLVKLIEFEKNKEVKR